MGLKDNFWDRRAFLKAALVGTFLFLGSPVLGAELIEGKKPGDSKDGTLAVAEPAAAEPARKEDSALQEPARLILVNSHTGEKLDVVYRDECGAYDPQALSQIDYLMRCHYSHKQVPIDPRVIEYLYAVDKSFDGGGNEIQVISGYRSPEYNKILRRRGRRRVARNSLHMAGKAIDFRIPGVKVSHIRKAALAMQFGGVGYYPRRGFVHIDSGRFRHW